MKHIMVLRYNFKELNDIEVPLFMRWGNKNDLIMQPAEELVNMLKEKIKNKKFKKVVDILELFLYNESCVTDKAF